MLPIQLYTSHNILKKLITEKSYISGYVTYSIIHFS